MKTRLGLLVLGMSVITLGAYLLRGGKSEAAAPVSVNDQERVAVYQESFEVQVLIDGRPAEKYYANGRMYIEALKGAEYEVRIRNPLPMRVAVALSVDGLNSIDARRTSAWNASKWVIGPYETITVGGWQMSSERARRFYFTSESDSYAAKLGQTANLGLISAVFFRERGPKPITIVPPPGPRSQSRDESKRSAPTSSEAEGVARDKSSSMPRVDDDYAATGIGRSVRNDVRWINMELDSRPAGSTEIRYEYYSALVRLGVHMRPYPKPDPWPRRERATGFEDRRFSPEP
jgi:hypothetical protein